MQNLSCTTYGCVIKLDQFGFLIQFFFFFFFFFGSEKFRSFFAVLEALFSEGLDFRCSLFATVAWCLWQRRNRLREHQTT